MSLERFSKQSLIYDLVLSGLLAAIVAAGLQYFSEQRRERRQNTQDFVILFHGDVYSVHRDNILKFTLRPEVLKTIVDRNTMPEPEYVKTLLDEIGKQGDLIVSFVAMIDFFRDVKLCVETGLCDGPIAKAALRSYATDLYEGYYPLILDFVCNFNMRDAEDAVLFFTQSVSPVSLDCKTLSAKDTTVINRLP